MGYKPRIAWADETSLADLSCGTAATERAGLAPWVQTKMGGGDAGTSTGSLKGKKDGDRVP